MWMKIYGWKDESATRICFEIYTMWCVQKLYLNAGVSSLTQTFFTLFPSDTNILHTLPLRHLPSSHPSPSDTKILHTLPLRHLHSSHPPPLTLTFFTPSPSDTSIIQSYIKGDMK